MNNTQMENCNKKIFKILDYQTELKKKKSSINSGFNSELKACKLKLEYLLEAKKEKDFSILETSGIFDEFELAEFSKNS